MISFALIGAAAVAAALGVVTARHPVHSVLWLIVHLCSLAVLYMTLHAPFLGLVQVLLYAGAVMVLFLFVLGLLSARTRPDPAEPEPLIGQLGWTVGAGVVIAAVLLLAAGAGAAAAHPHALPAGFGGVSAFGKALFGPYLLPFEATALALLTAIVGVVALSVGHDDAMRRPQSEPEGPALDVSHAAVELRRGVGEGRD